MIKPISIFKADAGMITPRVTLSHECFATLTARRAPTINATDMTTIDSSRKATGTLAWTVKRKSAVDAVEKDRDGEDCRHRCEAK